MCGGGCVWGGIARVCACLARGRPHLDSKQVPPGCRPRQRDGHGHHKGADEVVRDEEGPAGQAGRQQQVQVGQVRAAHHEELGSVRQQQ